jgi:hypothetical protein
MTIKPKTFAFLFLLLAMGKEDSWGQETLMFFPHRSSMPALLAGPRDPATSASIFVVDPNPNALGRGVEVEVSIGSTLPVILLSGEREGDRIVMGLEAAVFARFGLQVLERELIASDWIFAVPIIWTMNGGWLRFRYYHTSSHMGDEYARRFDDPGINFSRDAAEILSYRTLSPRLGVYGGARYAYNVHPEESKRWVLRLGGELEASEGGGRFRPFVASDLEWDQDAGGTRIELKAGSWLPEIDGRRTLSLALIWLTGPSPLGQFNRLTTTQFGLSLRGNL